MRFHRSLSAAAFLGAAAVAAHSFAQDVVPTPPPAGVPAKSPRMVPMQPTPPVQTPQPVPTIEEQSLPQIPENAIKLEQNFTPAVRPAPAGEPMPVDVPMTGTSAAPPVARKPVKPKGPVYYYAPYGIAADVTTPPAMHVPNSPWVEDLSVAGDHGRYVYYSYRRPWYTPGQLSANVTIIW